MGTTSFYQGAKASREIRRHILRKGERDAAPSYAAFGRGDLDGYLSACTDDFIFNVPGDSAVSGAYRGKAGIYELAGKVMELSTASFQEDVEDVLANDRHDVVLTWHHFTRSTQPKSTEPRMFTGFAAASCPNAGSIHVTRPSSMTLGARLLRER